MTISRSRLSFGVATTLKVRFLNWHQVPLDAPMAWAGLDNSLFIQSDGTWPPDWVGGHRGRGYQLPLELSVEQQLHELRQLGPVWLRTRPSVLLQLALAVAESPGLKPELLGVLTEGEILTADHRRLCCSVFDCMPIDSYSLREVWDVALQCAASSMYHVQTEAVYTELLNDRDQPCRRGEIGRVVVTALYNLATPIIRYDTGDYAVADENFSRFSGHFCTCGNRLLRLKTILGRKRNLLRVTKIHKQHPDLQSLQLFEMSGATLWQLAELDRDRMELRLCTSRRLSDRDRRKIADHARTCLSLDTDIAVAQANLAQMYQSRKFEPYLCETEEQVAKPD